MTVLKHPLIGETDSSDRALLLSKKVEQTLRLRAFGVLSGPCSDPWGHSEDAVQQAKLQLLKALRKRPNQYDDRVAVLFTAVVNVAKTHLKKCRKEAAVDFDELVAGQAECDQIFNRRDRLALTKIVNPIDIFNGFLDIKEKLQHVSDVDLFIRHYVEGYQSKEIANKRRWTQAKVSRALKKLRLELGIRSKAETKAGLSQKVNRIMTTERRAKWAKTAGGRS